MWLSEPKRGMAGDGEEAAMLGMVTLEGAPAGAYVDGERRELPVFGPGGFYWKPVQGQQVLVLKTGAEGELPCIAGVRVEGGGLRPGEVALVAADGGAGLTLELGGNLRMTGEVFINGETLTDLVRRMISGGGTGG